LLVPGARPPAATVPSRGRQVCTCFNVSETQILQAMPEQGSVDERLAAVQTQLKCGTNCGSCVPELKKLLRGQLQAA
ncbi:(2Fe-2S)-binding protein, partial [Vibrio vulnificus]|uniref:(2Fe-2S)-binding protein n=1 Tax=Vibrio vulnificus TaxID=672 RepID=UPI0019D4176C